MSFTMPTAQNLHTQGTATDSTANIFGTARYSGTMNSASSKASGNLPLTSTATQLSIEGNNTAGIRWDNPAFDATTTHKIYIGGFQFNAPNRIGVDTAANGGVFTRVYSGASPTTDYVQFTCGGNDTFIGKSQAGVAPFIIDPLAAGGTITGSFDNTAVAGWGKGYQATNSGSATNEPRIWTFFCRTYIISTEKDAADIPKFTGVSNFQNAVDLSQGVGDYTTKIHEFAQRSGDVVNFIVPFQIGDGGTTLTTFDDGGLAVVSPADTSSGHPIHHLSDDAMRVFASIGASDSITLSGTYIWGTPAEWDFDTSLGTIAINGASFSGMGSMTLGSAVTISDGIFSLDAFSFVTDNGAVFSGGIFNSNIIVTTGTKTYTAIAMASGTKMAVLDASGGTYTLDDCVVDEIENISGVDITVILSNGSPTPTLTETSGAITLANPMTVTFTGLTAGVEWIFVEDNLDVQQLYVQATGSTEILSIPLSDDAEVWTYVVKREGYSAQIGAFTVIAGGTLTIAVSLTQQLRGDGVPMYTASTDPNASIVVANGTPQISIDIADAEVAAQTVYDETQDALITQDGMVWLAAGRAEVAYDALIGDYLFLTANIRLRREAVSDANAAVPAYVYSTDSIPVDDVNGSVAFGLVVGDSGITAGDVWEYVLEDVVTAEEMMRVIMSAASGVSSDMESDAPKYQDIAKTKNRISATNDANFNRTSVVLDTTP